MKLAKKAKQNRPIPQWIRFRTDNTIRCAAAALATFPLDRREERISLEQSLAAMGC